MQTFKDEGISGPAIAKPPSLQDLLAVVAKLTCGACGGPMIRSGADQRFMCSWRRERGKLACTNGRGIKSAEIEARVLAAIKTRLLAPERVALAVEEARLAAQHDARTITQARSKLESELAEVKRRAERW